MNLKNVREIVGSIKSSLFKNSNGFSIGMLKSHFKGSGLQFKEHMVYSHGDDIRFIDWNLTAKTQNTFVKTFEEERNVEIVVVLDLSASMFLGYKGISKLQAAIEICCLLFLLSSETNDYVQVLILGDSLTSLPKASGEKGIALLVSKLEEMSVLNDSGKVNINYPYDFEIKDSVDKEKALKYLKRNKEVVILSDFINFLDAEQMKKIAFRKHVHCFRIVGPLDEAQKQNYSLFTKNSDGSGVLAEVQKKKVEDIEDILGKRVKKLNVKDRYLESFIKEMM
ncbi:conserved hypothetical protein [Halobacteriovorax marinus SJ]|uniref:DUF58 domain-containing protein n=1 Tax=Halobacteriovorax marinus (strain ATCC BAA-682 / DSM 15412 / SJ) TaxID=862908 RepID=E1X294_HALMS|nr:DUF58 domain-containing protein [Halobacteriovorax marinus]CBW25050.1 conserved hypothetical protein [Halobacteriovorax marinus SJ]